MNMIKAIPFLCLLLALSAEAKAEKPVPFHCKLETSETEYKDAVHVFSFDLGRYEESSARQVYTFPSGMNAGVKLTVEVTVLDDGALQLGIFTDSPQGAKFPNIYTWANTSAQHPFLLVSGNGFSVDCTPLKD